MEIYKLFSYFNELTRHLQKPQWKTNYTIVHETNSYKLLDFSKDHDGIPTLILPPQAGGHSSIVDYNSPNASLINTCLKNNRTNLFCVEYKTASIKNNQKCIDDLINDTEEIIQKLGNHVRLVALCQGVWQAVMYTSLYPDTIHDMILSAGPVDFSADKNNKIFQLVSSTPDYWYDLILFLNNGIWPGSLQGLGFKLIDPFKKIIKLNHDLYMNIEDKQWLDRHRRFVDWMDSRQDLGAWSVDATHRLFLENQLVKGCLRINNKKVNMKNIKCHTTLMWADKDDITSEMQLRNYKKYAINSKITEMQLKNCGHIGAFISKRVLNKYWPKALNI